MENQDSMNKSGSTPQGGNQQGGSQQGSNQQKGSQQGTNSSDQPQRDENNKNKEANPSERNFTAETDADTDASEETTETNKPKMSGDVKGGNTDKTGTDRSAGNSTL
ncbi:MAG: hypothetical protein IPF75_11535 [Bacteroidetes bacterium]|nr:hypothetical protein [Bacteroidota bacterium]